MYSLCFHFFILCNFFQFIFEFFFSVFSVTSTWKLNDSHQLFNTQNKKKVSLECAKISNQQTSTEIEPNEPKPRETQPCHKIIRKTLKQHVKHEQEKRQSTVCCLVRGGAREIWSCSCLYCIIMYPLLMTLNI